MQHYQLQKYVWQKYKIEVSFEIRCVTNQHSNGLVLAGKLVATQHTVLPFEFKYKMLTILCKYFVQNKPFGITYTRNNLTTCSKSANKPPTSCVRTACYKLSTSLEQAVKNL